LGLVFSVGCCLFPVCLLLHLILLMLAVYVAPPSGCLYMDPTYLANVYFWLCYITLAHLFWTISLYYGTLLSTGWLHHLWKLDYSSLDVTLQFMVDHYVINFKILPNEEDRSRNYILLQQDKKHLVAKKSGSTWLLLAPWFIIIGGFQYLVTQKDLWYSVTA